MSVETKCITQRSGHCFRKLIEHVRQRVQRGFTVLNSPMSPLDFMTQLLELKESVPTRVFQGDCKPNTDC